MRQVTAPFGPATLLSGWRGSEAKFRGVELQPGTQGHNDNHLNLAQSGLRLDRGEAGSNFSGVATMQPEQCSRQLVLI